MGILPTLACTEIRVRAASCLDCGRIQYRVWRSREKSLGVFRSPNSFKQAKKFDTLVGQTVFQCLGLKPTDEAYEQASVSTTIGGLGIRRTIDHAKGELV